MTIHCRFVKRRLSALQTTLFVSALSSVKGLFVSALSSVKRLFVSALSPVKRLFVSALSPVKRLSSISDPYFLR
jgi:hypothetical protein